MSIQTYAELQTSIANWLKSSDLTDYIPDFIALAEAEINNRLRTKEMQKRATNTASTTSRYLSLPTRYAEMYELFMTYQNSEWYLENVTVDQLKKFRSTVAGQPKHFSVWGQELEFNRTPLAAYTVEMSYYQEVQALSDSNTTNSVLTRYPNIYLFGALAEAEPFLMNDERIAVWQGKFDSAIQSANDAHSLDQNIGPIRGRSTRQVV